MTGDFQIDMSGVGPTIKLDGEELTNVRQVTVRHTHGELPEVGVVFDSREITLKGRGEIKLFSATGPTPSEFLKAVNVDKLGQLSIQNADFATNPMAAFIEELKALADAY